MYQNLERTVGIPSTYQVSLDESPRTRWNHVVNHKLKEVSLYSRYLVLIMLAQSISYKTLVDIFYEFVI